MFQKNVSCQPLKKISSWRRISLATWEKPQDPSVYGLIELDMTRGLQLLERLKKQSLARKAGERGRLHPALPVERATQAPIKEVNQKITITHLLIKAMAKTLERFPEINVLIRRNHLYLRENIDIFVQVFLEEKTKADLSGAKIRDAHLKSLNEIAKELESQSQKIREGNDPNLKKAKKSLQFLNPTLLKWAIKILGYFSYDLNISPAFLKLPPDPFGTVMITNVGMFGLKMGWAPLVPFSRTPMVLLVGEINEQPVVQNGVVVIKPILNVGVTVDHRIIDGYLAGKAAAEFKRLLEEPEELTKK